MGHEKIVARWVRAALLVGIVYFGFIFPDSLSDHQKILHFSAHVGMSFLVSTCIYVICSFTLRMSRTHSLIILSVLTLVIGAIYKYLEISSEGLLDGFHNYSLGLLLKITGCYTSMSQNTAGLLAAILLIDYTISYLPKMKYNIR